MRQLLAFFMTAILTSAAIGAELSSTIPIKFVRGQSLEKYLDYYLFWRIPVDQIVTEPDSDILRIHGHVTFDLRRLPTDLQAQMKTALAEVMAGERTYPGVRFDFSQGVLLVLDAETDRLAEESAVKAREADERAIADSMFNRDPNAKRPPVNHGSAKAVDEIDVDPLGGAAWGGCSNLLKY